MFDREQLALLIHDHAPNPTILVRVEPDGGYRCASVNRAYLTRLGLPETDVIGKPIDQVCPPAEMTLTKYRQVSEARQPLQYESDAADASVFQTTLTPILDDAGQCGYVLGISQDITELVRAERAERERRIFADHLRQVATLMNSTLDLDQVLEQALINVGHVVPHDAANIVLLNGDGVFRVARARGYAGGLATIRELTIGTRVAHLKMIETKLPIVIDDVRRSANWNTLVPGTEQMRAYAGAPLCTRARVIGFLNLESATPGCFSPTHAERLQMFANLIAVAVENARLHAQIRELSIVDELTGIYNRRGLFQFGEREISRALRYARPFAALMLDLDGFKRVNDTFGHRAGDAVLRDVAQRCRENVRTIDVVARYGGEEFVVLLPETDVHSAQLVAERLRQAIADVEFPIHLPERECAVHLTASFGVAGMHAQLLNLSALIDTADHAQYRAKKVGGNLVVVD
ncbi:MAG: diguanylate cyclase [Chloroflexi bacterium]|nr:diguanylate cyclase [Chloroflexota bacterium]